MSGRQMGPRLPLSKGETFEGGGTQSPIPRDSVTTGPDAPPLSSLE